MYIGIIWFTKGFVSLFMLWISQLGSRSMNKTVDSDSAGTYCSPLPHPLYMNALGLEAEAHATVSEEGAACQSLCRWHDFRRETQQWNSKHGGSTALRNKKA